MRSIPMGLGIRQAPRATLGVLLAGLALATGVGVQGHAQDLSAKEVMQKNYQALHVSDVKSTTRLTLFNPSGQTRIRVTRSRAKLQENQVDYARFIEFQEPADVRGTKILTVEHSGGDDDVWTYLPALRKSKRIASSEKGSSFMGTEFSYADLLTSRIEDYTFTPHGTEQISGVDCYVIEARPATQKVATETGYSRKMLWIRKDNFVESKIDYFDKGGALLKTMTLDNTVEVDPARHTWITLKKEMVNVQTRRKTTIELSDIETNTGMSNEMFTLNYLERK